MNDPRSASFTAQTVSYFQTMISLLNMECHDRHPALMDITNACLYSCLYRFTSEQNIKDHFHSVHTMSSLKTLLLPDMSNFRTRLVGCRWNCWWLAFPAFPKCHDMEISRCRINGIPCHHNYDETNLTWLFARSMRHTVTLTYVGSVQ